jgi:hygromycin-B 4-O-kinase
LIHGDLLNRNVLVNGDEITAVFDWGNAMYGDALYDAAWFLYWWPWFPNWSEIDIHETLMQHWEKQEAVPVDVDKRLLAYQLHIGLDHLAYTASIGRWEDLSRNDQQVRELLSRS